LRTPLLTNKFGPPQAVRYIRVSLYVLNYLIKTWKVTLSTLKSKSLLGLSNSFILFSAVDLPPSSSFFSVATFGIYLICLFELLQFVSNILHLFLAKHITKKNQRNGMPLIEKKNREKLIIKKCFDSAEKPRWNLNLKNE
jgi:hypothetical protein